MMRVSRALSRAMLAPTRPAFARVSAPDSGWRFLTPVSDPGSSGGSGRTEMVVTLTRQDDFIFKEKAVSEVTLQNTSDGGLGVMGGHEYTVLKLEAGALKFKDADGQDHKFVTAGGWAVVSNDNRVDINTAETISVDDIEAAEVNKQTEILKAASTNSDKERLEVEIQLNMLATIQGALAA